MKFSIKDFFSKCDQILNGKLHVLATIFETTSGNPAYTVFKKVNSRNTRRRREICSELTIKTPERRY